MGGGLCDFGVTPVPIGLGFGTALGLGLRGPDLGLGLDNCPQCSFTSYIVKDHPRDECERRIEAVCRHPEIMQQRGSLVRIRAPGDRLRGCRRYSKFLQTRILGADDSRAHDATDQGDMLPGLRYLDTGIT